MSRNRWVWPAVAVLTVLALAAAAYAFVIFEGSSARGEPPALERRVAQWLLHRTVPATERARRNPLAERPDPADLAAGQQIYRRKCEICHAYDGGGKTEIAAGEYPRPPDLRSASVQGLSDGEIRYHIMNGIRHTGMPGWTLGDREGWQLLRYLRRLPLAPTPAQPSSASARASVEGAQFVGSLACRSCHEAIYERWQRTRMANVVRDPRAHPEAIAPDLSRPDPLLSFTRQDIAFVYGSRWKQRYFTRIGDDYFPLPAQWDFTHRAWRPYFVKSGTDWWVPYYPTDNLKRPTGPLCDGCHSVAYDIKNKTVAEWNVGCERCHGAGSLHAQHPRADNIIDPKKLDYVSANDVCISCHSQGRPLENPMAGRYYDWPVGYRVGLNLRDFWMLEEHKPGEQSFTHFADGTAHKNRMQGNDFVQSLMYARGVACFSCHDVHGTDNDSMLWQPGSAVCMNCHGPNTQNGPHAPSIEAHTHHPAGSPGSDCIACHMPKIEQTIADVNVHAHTFKFISPSQSVALGIPNPCSMCHADKSAAWAIAALRSWPEKSPWRVAQ